MTLKLGFGSLTKIGKFPFYKLFHIVESEAPKGLSIGCCSNCTLGRVICRDLCRELGEFTYLLLNQR